MLKSYKYRLVPNKGQAELINKHIGSCRFIYNLALEVKNYAYSSHRKNISCFELINQLPDLKKELPWLREVCSQSLQQSVINLDRAFTGFFKGNSAFPKFKNKNKTVSFKSPNGAFIKIKNNRLYQPKFKDGIKVIIDRDFVGTIKNTTISRSKTGKYFVAVLVDDNKEEPAKVNFTYEKSIGIDLGLKSLIVTSDGIKVDNPRHFKKQLHRLAYLSKQYSKKTKGSKNKHKAKIKLALCYEKISNQRADFLHKLSSKLIKNHDTLCFETLKIDNMLKNRKLSKSIQDAGWGMFVEMCKYKSTWSGKNVLQIPTFQPSTKICSNCGATNHTLTLADREWVCANCMTFHDRDINAAINIKNYSLRDCGGVHRVKSDELPTLVGALKQK